MKIGIPKEVHQGERRVAATPDTVVRLKKLGFHVLVEAGAGAGASFTDQSYETVGAEIVSGPRELWGTADIVLKVRAPSHHAGLRLDETELLREGMALICFIWPAQNQPLVSELVRRRVTVLAMDQVPRISRAQKLDALSSMANIAGYRAVVEAANRFGRFFTGQITAAGKVPPAKVLIIGAGVAGLAAIGTAKGLGAIVRAFDTRPVVREQVNSMGAEFLEVQLAEDGSGEGGYAREMSPAFIAAEMELFRRQAKEVDIIITTALIPGKPAPRLLPKDIVELMRPGSVVVDLAAEAGGNCELTVAGQVVEHNGISIIGYTDLPSRMAPTASQLYGSNLVHLLSDMGGAEKWQINLEDEVVRGAIVTHDGVLLWPAPKPPAKPVPIKAAEAKTELKKPGASHGHSGGKKANLALPLSVVTVLLAGLGWVAPASFLSHLTVFVLACFVGWQVVWNVTPALHTPLMSVTNAVSGIILLGGMLKISGAIDSPVTLLAAAAVLVATINIAGGFLVTQRMLTMFRR